MTFFAPISTGKRHTQPMTRLLLLLMIALIALPASASKHLQQCADQRSSSIDYLRCLDRKIDFLEREIDQWTTSKIFELEEMAKKSGRTDALSLFKKSQKSFTKYLEHSCRWQYSVLLPDARAAAIRYKECTVQMSETRVSELKRIAGR